MKVMEYLEHYLWDTSVEYVFGVGGAYIEDLMHYIGCRKRVRVVIAKHEYSAGTMAQGYYLSSKKIGVVLSTAGGAAFNLIPAIAEAFTSSIPLLVIIGQVPVSQEGRGLFQDMSGVNSALDTMRIFQPVCCSCKKVVAAEEFIDALHGAVSRAFTERGPVVLLLPKDVQRSALQKESVLRGRSMAVTEPHLPTYGKQLRIAERVIRNSAQPLIIAGIEVVRAEARDELALLARTLETRVAVTPEAKNAFDHQSPYFGGVVGVMGHENSRRQLSRTDLCILLGTRLNSFSSYSLTNLIRDKIVVNINPTRSYLSGITNEDGSPLFEIIDVLGPVKDIMRELNMQLGSHNPFPRLIDEREDLRYIETPAPGVGGNGLTLRRSVEIIAARIDRDADIFVDAGNTGAALIHYLSVSGKGVFSVALGTGIMGYSFGAAIGAAVHTRRKTYVFAGDGAFFMNGMEIHTAMEYNLPVTFIIFDNSAHAMCHIREMIYLGVASGCNLFRESRIAQGLRSMFPGILAIETGTEAELASALEAVRRHAGVSCISLHTQPDEIPPFQPFVDAMSSGR